MDLLLPHLGLIVWTLLAFLIVFFILKKFAWKPILKSLGEREDNIANSIATAEKVKLEMAQLKNDNEALLVQAREERALMLKDAKETKDKIIGEATPICFVSLFADNAMTKDTLFARSYPKCNYYL